MKVFISKTVFNTFNLHLMGHAPNPVYSSLLDNRIENYVEALKRGQAILAALNAQSFYGDRLEHDLEVMPSAERDMAEHHEHWGLLPLAVNHKISVFLY